MVVRTRSYSHSYDNRRFYSANDGASWSSVGFSVEQHVSSISADYPEWNFRRVIDRGENATTWMSGQSSGFRSQPIQGDPRQRLARPTLSPSVEGWGELAIRSWSLVNGVQSSIQRHWVRGNIWRAGLTVPSETTLLTSVSNQALQKFNRKVLKAHRDLQGLVTAGELGESLRMIRNPAKSLRRGVSNYLDTLRRRGNRNRRRSPDRLHRIASDTWLEYSFGWKPLISDVEAGCEALANALHLRPPRIFVKASAFGHKNVLVPGGGASGVHGEIRYRYDKELRNHNVGVKYYGVVKTPIRATGFDASRFGWGLWTEIVPTVWELIPYSFLVDYFTNVGAIIEGYSAMFSDVEWCTKGTSVVNESSWSNVTLTPEVGTGRFYVVLRRTPGSRCFKVNRTILRETDLNTSVPRFEFQIPGMGLRWLNMAALSLSRDRALFALRGR